MFDAIFQIIVFMFGCVVMLVLAAVMLSLVFAIAGMFKGGEDE